MRRFLEKLWPKTLAEQIPLVVALALTIAQILNIFLLLGERQIEALSARTTLAERACTSTAAQIARAPEPLRQPELRQLATPFMTFFISRDGLPVRAQLTPDPALANRVRASLLRDNLNPVGLEAGTRNSRPNAKAPQGTRPMDETFIAFRFTDGAPWYVCHVINDAPEKFVTLRLLLSTILTFAIVLGVTVLVTRRIVRPLTELSGAVARVGKDGDRPALLPVDGPAEISAVATALNEMSERIAMLLQEKDAMLGRSVMICAHL